MTLANAIFGLAGATLLAAVGCDRETLATAPEVPPARPIERVVSLSPLATRFVLALGARDRLVAADPASLGMPELAGLPAVDLDGALRLAPDLVLLPEAPAPGSTAVAELHRRGARIAEFAPHDFEDVFALVQGIGADLGGAEGANRLAHSFSSPLAAIGGASAGQLRPRVVAVVSFDPLVIAGGHSFETDLIEIAGGTSVTHPGDETRLAIGADRWHTLAPDLVLVIAARPASPHQEQAIRNALPAGAEVAFFPFDSSFWLEASDEPARRLRAVIEPLSARLTTPASR